MKDPLAQFRKTPILPNGQTKPPIGADEYIAFDAKDKVDRLKIRRANDPTRSPGYAYLLDIVYDGPFGTNFVLVYTFLMVLVRGRNLQGLTSALEMGTVDFIPFGSDSPKGRNAVADAAASLAIGAAARISPKGAGTHRAKPTSAPPLPVTSISTPRRSAAAMRSAAYFPVKCPGEFFTSRRLKAAPRAWPAKSSQAIPRPCD